MKDNRTESGDERTRNFTQVPSRRVIRSVVFVLHEILSPHDEGIGGSWDMIRVFILFPFSSFLCAWSTTERFRIRVYVFHHRWIHIGRRVGTKRFVCMRSDGWCKLEVDGDGCCRRLAGDNR